MSGFGGAHPHSPVEGATCEWWTPPHVFEALGLGFDLDPCAPPPPAADWIPAAYRYSEPEDGLSLPWHGRVWLNPPYGREAGRWVAKLAGHGNGIALVFSRTDVKWWHDAAPKATAVCFIRGRLTFVAGAGQSAPGNSGGPSALLAFGEDCAEAIARSGLGLTYFTHPEERKEMIRTGALPVGPHSPHQEVLREVREALEKVPRYERAVEYEDHGPCAVMYPSPDGHFLDRETALASLSETTEEER